MGTTTSLLSLKKFLKSFLQFFVQSKDNKLMASAATVSEKF